MRKTEEMKMKESMKFKEEWIIWKPSKEEEWVWRGDGKRKKGKNNNKSLEKNERYKMVRKASIKYCKLEKYLKK